MGKRSGILLGLIAIMISAGVGGYVLYDNFIVIPPTLPDEISGTNIMLVIAMFQPAPHGVSYQRLLFISM